MKVYAKKRYKNELTVDVANKILTALDLPTVSRVEYKTGNGRSVIAEHDGRRYYIIASRENADARNAFLAQYIPTVLSEYIDDRCDNKSLYIYLLDTSAKARSAFITDTYRVAKTLGIDIINERELNAAPVMPYLTFKDWKYAKTERQNYNSANNASYAMEDDNAYTVFGKLYGANGKESALTACLLAKIAENEGKTVNFVQVKEHGTETISGTNKKILDFYGVNISDGSIVLKDRGTHDRSTCRKQDEFIYNLLEKYGPKKCYLCECDIESNIIASHIHRVTDIDHSDLSDSEKRRQAVDADNGFWLCANHDKLFEYGVVTFDKEGRLVLSPTLKENQTEFINRITKNRNIADEHLTENLIKYLSIHNRRVNLGI